MDAFCIAIGIGFIVGFACGFYACAQDRSALDREIRRVASIDEHKERA